MSLDAHLTNLLDYSLTCLENVSPYLIPFACAAPDLFDYFFKRTMLRPFNKRQERRLDSQDYPENLEEILKNNVAFIVSIHNPKSANPGQMEALHSCGKGNYLDWIYLGLNNGTAAQAKRFSGFVKEVYCMPHAYDKAIIMSEILMNLPSEIDTVIVKDYPSKIEDWNTCLKAIYDHRKSAAGATTVDIIPDNYKYEMLGTKRPLLAHFQRHEYDIAMDVGRSSLSTLGYSYASGAFCIYDRKALEDVAGRLSFHWLGEDKEASLAMVEEGYTLRHDNRCKVTATRSPSNWHELRMQRKNWKVADIKEWFNRWYLGLKRGYNDFKNLTFLKDRKKSLQHIAIAYQHYLQNFVLENAMYPLKIAGTAAILASGANLIENQILWSNYIPQEAGLFGLRVTLDQKLIVAYASALSGMNIFHYLRSNMPKSKEALLAAAAFPLYHNYIKFVPDIEGIGKFCKEFWKRNAQNDLSINRVEGAIYGHTTPIPEISHRSWKGTFEDIKDIGEMKSDEIKEIFLDNKDKGLMGIIGRNIEEGEYKSFRNEIYLTRPYDDSAFMLADPKYIDMLNLKESPKNIYGLTSLAGLEWSIQDLEKMARNFSGHITEEDDMRMDFELRPGLLQKGYITRLDNKHLAGLVQLSSGEAREYRLMVYRCEDEDYILEHSRQIGIYEEESDIFRQRLQNIRLGIGSRENLRGIKEDCISNPNVMVVENEKESPVDAIWLHVGKAKSNTLMYIANYELRILPNKVYK